MKTFEVGELHPNTPHLFADLAELLLLVGYNGRTKIHSNDLEKLLNDKTINSDELDGEEEAQQAETSSASINSRQDRQIEDVLIQLSYRSGAFADWYPFSLNGDTLCVSTNLNEKQRVYRHMLACSRLRSFGTSGLPQRWAKVFTRVAKLAFEGLAPPKAVTRIFDANSDDRKAYYGTDLRQALPILGKDLGISINERNCNKANASGDAGFDLVANLDFDDGAAITFSLLGQCGAQETNWPSKTLEAHSIQLRHLFQVQFEYPSVMMTPVCFRTADGEWVDDKCSNGIFLADRSRILQLIDSQQCVQNLVSQNWFIDFEAEFNQFTPESNN